MFQHKNMKIMKIKLSLTYKPFFLVYMECYKFKSLLYTAQNLNFYHICINLLSLKLLQLIESHNFSLEE